MTSHFHPHFIEEVEYQMGDHPDSAAYDRREAQMGAAYNGNTEDEWLLTSRDVWVRNPSYAGCPEGPHPEVEWTDEEWNDWYERESRWTWQREEAERLLHNTH